MKLVKHSIWSVIFKFKYVSFTKKYCFQETFWKRIIDFVSAGHRYLGNFVSGLDTTKNKSISIRNKRTEEINQLLADGQNDAAILYEKYLRRKLEEIKFINEVSTLKISD